MDRRFYKRDIVELEAQAAGRRSGHFLPDLVLVADNIRSALNVGSLFRTADVFGIREIWLCGITACPPHREILKTALGATDWVTWHYAKEVVAVADTLHSRDYLLVGLEQVAGSTPMHQFQSANRSIALFVGNELHGLSDSLLPLLDECLEIPQWGGKHSLNVAVAAGIATWELRRRYL